MTAVVVDGKAIAAGVRAEVSSEVRRLTTGGIRPRLRVILVGEDPASMVYVGLKEKAALECGILGEVVRLPRSTSQAELLALVGETNADPSIHGLLVQLPLPDHIDERTVLESVDPDKDVDGIHPMNVGRLVAGQARLVSGTPAGCIEILDRHSVPLAGAEAVVVGRSNIVGKPVALLLMHRHATVTICHSRTRDLAATTRRADVLIVAAGVRGLVTGDMVKPGAAVIDVGTNSIPDLRPGRADGATRLVGDVDFDSVSAVAGLITPVPGGVGPLTVAMVLRNTVIAAGALQPA
ncbi:MAG: bifunctional 5,10-methylenetetrahydrofolate dehydrogenase/5,10-methenyltetrahydrofolate cyclohydrolase [Candidatus Dormibacteria bacterium]